jgi:hypothetical protein
MWILSLGFMSTKPETPSQVMQLSGLTKTATATATTLLQPITPTIALQKLGPHTSISSDALTTAMATAMRMNHQLCEAMQLNGGIQISMDMETIGVTPHGMQLATPLGQVNS